MSRSTLLLGIAVAMALVSTRWIKLNLSPSVPVGFYWLTAVPAEVARGALVVLVTPASIQHLWPRWVPLLKPVAGVPGDVVCAQEERLLVNGADYGPIYLETHDRPLPHLDAGCQVVAAGMVFLASQTPQSLDGRYFGLTPVDRLNAAATPLLTWR